MDLRLHRMRKAAISLFILPILLGLVVSPASAQGANGLDTRSTASSTASRPTTLDGVFSPEQVARGRSLFSVQCGSCHEVAGTGQNNAPGLEGERFVDHWRGNDLEILFRIMRAEMPPAAPDSLGDDGYLAIYAFILYANGFPAGDRELTLGALENIRFEGLDGPQPLPAGALVLSVGCLARAEDETWMLTRASDLIRAKVFPGTNAEELETSRATPPGTGNLVLRELSYAPGFDAEESLGQRVQVKGLLVRLPDVERISVTSLDVIGSCQ